MSEDFAGLCGYTQEELESYFQGYMANLHMPKEAYYHSIFHCVIALLGLRIQSELATSRGRIDTFIETQEAYWIFEFKYAQSTTHYKEQKIITFNQALKRGYSDQFDTTKPLKTMAVIFDGESKQVAWWGEEESVF